MHAQITKHMSKKLTKMVPKPFQNGSWGGSGGHLGATLETRCFQDLIFEDFAFGSILGPLWDQFGLILGIIFLMFFWNGFLMALASIWAPKTPPKWNPRGCQNQNLNFIDVDAIYCTLATLRGVGNHNLSMFVLNPLLNLLLEPFWWFLLTWEPFSSHLGYPFCIDC